MHEQTEGHPLFLAEMVRDLLPSRAAAGSTARSPSRTLPKGVREVIGARLKRAPRRLAWTCCSGQQ